MTQPGVFGPLLYTQRQTGRSERDRHRQRKQNFEEVVLSEEFPQLSVQQLADILGRDDLNVSEESAAFEAILRWIAHEPEERKADIALLLSKIYICGGFNGNDCLQTAEFYSPETNQWTMISRMTCRRSGIGIVAYADHVYAVCGFDGSVRLSSAEVYNPRSNNWQRVSHMLTSRSNFGIEVLSDRLYVVGGYNGRSVCSNVEYYDATTDEWTEVCSLDTSRCAMSCCVLSGLPNMDEYVFPRESLSIVSLDDVSADSEDSSEDS